MSHIAPLRPILNNIVPFDTFNKQLTKKPRNAWSALALALLLLCLGMPTPSFAQFKTLVYFNKSTGEPPNAPLVQGFDGNLYGTSYTGGANKAGTVFDISLSGALTALYNFCSLPHCADGQINSVGLTVGTDGNYYGVTTQGGNVGGVCIVTGCGTVYRITPAGVLTTLYSFCAVTGCADGRYPGARLVQGPDGNLYGTTTDGGSCPTSLVGCGTLFVITTGGGLTTLHTFCSLANCADGVAPGQLIEGTDGNLYGTTRDGGAGSGGTFFAITTQGVLTTIYNFCSLANCADGEGPSGVVQGADGNFYGTTEQGGVPGAGCNRTGGCGTAFIVTPEAVLTTLYNFCSLASCADGSLPESQLIQATDGLFYGTTALGGSKNYGTLFKLTSAQALTTLRNFLTNNPSGAVVQATTGNLYGTTSTESDGGTIYEWITKLKPFVETLPTLGPVGGNVTILGNSLSGASAVRFNGTTATFTVVSATEISATVPSGATTGSVTVTLPTGKLTSNVAFNVVP